MPNYLAREALVIGGEPKEMPQSQPIPFAGQSRNNAGGYGWAVDDWTRLHRWLVLGSEGGTYYTNQRALTVENAEAVRRCIESDGMRAVREIVEISHEGRAPKNDPALLALAMCASFGSDEVKAFALASLPKVARIGTHLFHFVDYANKLRGWGPQLKRAVREWYTTKPIAHVANQVIKYRQRDGWSHRDLLRLSHPEATGSMNSLFHWVTQGELGEETEGLEQVQALIELQACGDIAKARDLVRKHRLPRECVPTEMLNDRGIWQELLEDMPLTAMIRNLATMTRVGLFESRENIAYVCQRITDAENIRRSRVHPIAVLAALVTYASGRGARGQHTWTVVNDIQEALDAAFYVSFQNAEPIGKRVMVALDVSGSMAGGEVSGVPGLTPRLASAAMSMLHRRLESNVQYVAFSHELIPIEIREDANLLQVGKAISGLPFGGTDCALPMLWAHDHEIDVDLFVIYTDNETWYGRVHPSQALQKYRDASGINAKLAVVAMTSGGFSIARPDDAGMMDFVGFDTATPSIIQQFGAGRL